MALLRITVSWGTRRDSNRGSYDSQPPALPSELPCFDYLFTYLHHNSQSLVINFCALDTTLRILITWYKLHVMNYISFWVFLSLISSDWAKYARVEFFFKMVEYLWIFGRFQHSLFFSALSVPGDCGSNNLCHLHLNSFMVMQSDRSKK